MLAPPEAIGIEQIIPTTGPHEQIIVDHETIWRLDFFAYITYDPDYGPGARVYRPRHGSVDADEIRSWLPK